MPEQMGTSPNGFADVAATSLPTARTLHVRKVLRLPPAVQQAPPCNPKHPTLLMGRPRRHSLHAGCLQPLQHSRQQLQQPQQQPQSPQLQRSPLQQQQQPITSLLLDLQERQVPAWLCLCLKNAVLGGADISRLTSEDLVSAGIRNPLHQRRVHREVQEFLERQSIEEAWQSREISLERLEALDSMTATSSQIGSDAKSKSLTPATAAPSRTGRSPPSLENAWTPEHPVDPATSSTNTAAGNWASATALQGVMTDAPPVLGTQGAKEGSAAFQDTCSDQNAKSSTGRSNLNDYSDARWPYLADASRATPSTSSKRRRDRALSGLQGLEAMCAGASSNITWWGQTRPPFIPMERRLDSDSNELPETPRPRQLPTQSTFSREVGYRMLGNVQDDVGLDFADWRESRLHNYGTLAFLEVLYRTAANGEAEALRIAVEDVHRQGEGLVRSLESLPCRSVLSRFNPKDSILADAPPPSASFWEWISSRLEGLESTKDQLLPHLKEGQVVLNKIRQILVSAASISRGSSGAAKIATTRRSSRNQSGLQLRQRRPVMFADVLGGGSGGGALVQVGSSESSIEDLNEQPSSGYLLEPSAPPTKASSQRLWALVLSMVKSSLPSNTTLGKCISESNRYLPFTVMQAHLTEVKEALARGLQANFHLKGEVRGQADAMIRDLEAAEKDLFAGYVRMVGDIEAEIRDSMVLSSTGQIEPQRIRRVLKTAIETVGSGTLIGNRGIEAAAASDIVGETTQGPSDPWSHLNVAPPWESSFLSALKVCEREERRLRLCSLMKSASIAMVAAQRMKPKGCLTRVTIVSGRCNVSFPSSSSIFCEVQVEGLASHRRSTTHVDPVPPFVWNMMIEFNGLDERDNLEFSVWRQDRLGVTRLGSASLLGPQLEVGFDGELALLDASFDLALQVTAERVSVNRPSPRDIIFVPNQGRRASSHRESTISKQDSDLASETSAVSP